MGGVALVAGSAGLTTLVRPDMIRRALGMPTGEGPIYALRIAGMMLTAFGLFLGGFATVFTLASGL